MDPAATSCLDQTNMKYGAYHRKLGWIEDTGVGGVYSWDVERAGWRDSPEQWVQELVATDIVDATDFQDQPTTVELLERHDWLFVRLL